MIKKRHHAAPAQAAERLMDADALRVVQAAREAANWSVVQDQIAKAWLAAERDQWLFELAYAVNSASEGAGAQLPQGYVLGRSLGASLVAAAHAPGGSGLSILIALKNADAVAFEGLLERLPEALSLLEANELIAPTSVATTLERIRQATARMPRLSDSELVEGLTKKARAQFDEIAHLQRVDLTVDQILKGGVPLIESLVARNELVQTLRRLNAFELPRLVIGLSYQTSMPKHAQDYSALRQHLIPAILTVVLDYERGVEFLNGLRAAVPSLLPQRYRPDVLGSHYLSGVGDSKSRLREIIAAATWFAGSASGSTLFQELLHEYGAALGISQTDAGIIQRALRLSSASDFKAAQDEYEAWRSHTLSDPYSLTWPSLDNKRWPYFRNSRLGGDWPRISIVTPSYNQAEYLEETILSVINQSYPNLEYIIVDGGSTDGSSEIIERYRTTFAHVIIEPDEGQSDALNKGFRVATGDYFGWINSDDLLAPGALYHHATAILSSEADVITGACAEFRNERIVALARPRAGKSDLTQSNLSDIVGKWQAGYFFGQPSTLFSRRAFEAIGSRLRTDLYYTMDVDLWYRLAGAGAQMSQAPAVTSFFRIHDRQKTNALDATLSEFVKLKGEYHGPFHNSEERAAAVALLLSQLGAGVRVVSYHRDVPLGTTATGEPLQLFSGLAHGRFEEVHGWLASGDASLPVVIVAEPSPECEAAVSRLRTSHPDAVLVGLFCDFSDLRSAARTASKVDFAITSDTAFEDLFDGPATVSIAVPPVAELLYLLMASEPSANAIRVVKRARAQPRPGCKRVSELALPMACRILADHGRLGLERGEYESLEGALTAVFGELRAEGTESVIVEPVAPRPEATPSDFIASLAAALGGAVAPRKPKASRVERQKK